MVKPSTIIEVRMKALQRQLQNIKSFVTEPTGVFETVDRIIRTARYANRETLQNLGIAITGQAIGRADIVKRIRDMLRSRLRLGQR